MAAKPSIADARWGETVGGAPAANIESPPSGARDTGSVAGTPVVSRYENWLKRQAYLWFKYVSDGVLQGTHDIVDGFIRQDASTQPETFGPEHHWYGRSGRWLAGIDVANALKSRDFVVAGRQLTYAFDDGDTTNASPTLTSAAQGGFDSSMVGAVLSGSGITPGTTVLSVASAISLTMSANATATATGVRVTVTQDGVHDIVYLKHRGRLQPTIGLGMTPPTGDYRTEIAGSDSENAMGGLGIRIGPTQTGHAFAIVDSNGFSGVALQQWYGSDFHWQGKAAGLQVKGDVTNERSVLMADSAKSSYYAFTHPAGSGGEMRVRYINGGTDILRFKTDGAFIHQSTLLAFYAGTPVTKPVVTGSRGGNAALASFLTALASVGLITNSTTA